MEIKFNSIKIFFLSKSYLNILKLEILSLLTLFFFHLIENIINQ
jgi:hypothetical protein